MVGDSVDDDIARRARVAACARCSSIATTAIPSTPGERIRGLGELPALLGLDGAGAASRQSPRRRVARRAAPSRSLALVAAFMSAQRSQVAPRSFVCTR